MKKLKLILMGLVVVFSLNSLKAQQIEGKKALLVMDMQVPILKEMPVNPLSKVAEAVKYARANGIKVMYVRASVREGAPEINENNKFFKARQKSLEKVNPEFFVQLPEEIAPQKGDIIIDKKRFSSFEGTDLDILLHSKGYTEVVLCGVMTSGVVLSTVRDAADRDYKITVLSDGCADPDSQTNEFLMKKIFPLQADVITVGQWTKK